MHKPGDIVEHAEFPGRLYVVLYEDPQTGQVDCAEYHGTCVLDAYQALPTQGKRIIYDYLEEKDFKP